MYWESQGLNQTQNLQLDKKDVVVRRSIFFKKDKKIVVYLNSTDEEKEDNKEQIQQFNIWQSRPFVVNKYEQLHSFSEALPKIINLVEKWKYNQGPVKQVYNLSQKFTIERDQKQQDFNQLQSLQQFSKVAFIDCSTQFIWKFFSIYSFQNKGDIIIQDPNINTYTFIFKKCKITDYDFTREQGVLGQLRFNKFEFKRNIVFYIKKCKNITDQTLQALGSLCKDPSSQQDASIIKNMGLKISHMPQISLNEFKHLTFQLYSKLLHKLKLINMIQFKDSNYLSEFLSYRQEFPDRSMIPLDELKEISFDRTVCNKFDDLPLHLNWNKMKKISYNGLDNKQKDTVNLSKLFRTSMGKLSSLKIRNCILTPEFFLNLANMDFCFYLRVLDFKGCQIDLEGFKSFLTLGLTPSLVKLNLSSTNIDDDVCSLIGTQTSVDSKNWSLLPLKDIDVSNIQSKSRHLIRINITSNDCVDDTLADHFVQLIKRRQEEIQDKNVKNQRFQLGQEILQMINLSGCKNITSSFFMTLNRNQMLNNVELLNVEGTSVCNNFIKILTKKRQSQKNEQNARAINIQSQSAADKGASASSSGGGVLRIKGADTNLQITTQKKKDLKDQGQVQLYQRYVYVFKTIPNYYKVLEAIYGLIRKQRKVKRVLREVKNDLKRLIKNDLKRKIESAFGIFSKIFKKAQSSIKQQNYGSSGVEKEKRELMGEEEGYPAKNLTYLNISKCRLIDCYGIQQLIKKAQWREKLRTLYMANVNLFDIKLVEGHEHNKILYEIINNFSSLLKLDISNNSLPSQCYEYCSDFFTLGKLNKLKANSTNFKLDFFNGQLGYLHEVQLNNCKQINQAELKKFLTEMKKDKRGKDEKPINQTSQSRVQSQRQEQEIALKERQSNSNSRSQRTSNQRELNELINNEIQKIERSDYSGNSVFNIFKFLSYFKAFVDDELLLDFFKDNSMINQNHYWNLKGFNLLEFDYEDGEDGDMRKFLNVISKSSKIESIDLSSTRVCNAFVSSMITENNVIKQHVQLNLKDCPMLDGSVFDQLNKSSTKSKVDLDAPLSILSYVKMFIKDENIKFFAMSSSKATKAVKRPLNLEYNQFLSEKALINILRSEGMIKVHTINLSYTHVNDEVLKVFSSSSKKDTSKKYQELKQLKLEGCKDITRDGLQIICESPFFNDGFDLECVFDFPHLLNKDLFNIISNSQYFKNVMFLDLSRYPYEDIDLGISQLCLKGKDVPLNIKVINLSSTWISDHGLQYISVSINLQKLERIILKDCPNIEDKGISYLFESKNLIALDFQFMILQASAKCKLRVFDTLKTDAKFQQIKELVFKENNISFEDIKRVIEKLKVLKNLESIRFESVCPLTMAQALELLVLIDKNTKVKYVSFPQETISSHQLNFSDNQLQSFKQSQNLESIDLSHFFRQNVSLLNSVLIGFMLETYLVKQNLKLQIIDLSKNMNLTPPTLSKLFQDLRCTVESVNVSYTQADFSVIQSILQTNNNYYPTLQTILFDKCSYLDYQKSLIEILKSESLELRKQQIFFRYKKYINKRVLNEYCINLLNKSFDNMPARYSPTALYRVSQGGYKLLEYLKIAKYSKSNISKILDLSGAPLSIDDFKYTIGLQTTVRILNFSSTYITEDELMNFFAIPFQPHVQQNLRYLWIDNTHNMISNRSQEKWLEFFNAFPLKNINFNELLYSKADTNSVFLQAFRESTNQNLLLCDSIKFDVFPWITEQQILGLLEQQKNLKNETINQIQLGFNIQNQEVYEKLREKLKISKGDNIKSVFVKNVYRGSIASIIKEENDEKEYPFYVLNEGINPFKGLNFNFDGGVQKMIEYDKINVLRILDLSQSIISLENLKLFFFSISSINQIEELNLSNHRIVTDQLLEEFIYQEEKKDNEVELQKSFRSVQASLKSLKKIEEESLRSLSFNSQKSRQHDEDREKADDKDEEDDEEDSEEEKDGENNKAFKGINKSFSISQSQNQSFIQSEEIKKESSEQLRKAQVENLEEPQSEVNKIKVFPYLKKLTIEKTSLTQRSLQLILEKKPFNEQFDAEHLLKQYTTLCSVTDSTLSTLSKSAYLQNFQTLNLSQCYFSCDSLLEIINSEYCRFIETLYLNCQYLNESIFITLAKTKYFPSLVKVIASNYEQCYQSLGYLAKAKYFDINFDLEKSTLLKEKLIYQSDKFINTIIGSIYMRNIKEMVFDNMNDNMLSLKELFSLSKYCYNVESIKITNIVDKKKYYFVWKELADSKCFPNLVSIQIETIKFTDNLHALIEQKNKPFIQIEKILSYQNLMNLKTIDILSKQKHLLNLSNFSIYSLCDFEKYSRVFEKNLYFFNITSLEFYDITIAPYGVQQIMKSPTKEIKDQNDQRCSITVEEALESIANCFPNLQRVIFSDEKNTEKGNPYLTSAISYWLNSYIKQQFSVQFEVFSLLNELAQKEIELPEISNFQQFLTYKHAFEGNEVNLSFFSLLSGRQYNSANNLSSLLENNDYLMFIKSITFLNPLQFTEYCLQLLKYHKQLRNVKQFQILDTKEQKEKSLQKSEQLFNNSKQILSYLKSLSINGSFIKLVLQHLIRFDPAIENIIQYLHEPVNNDELEFVLSSKMVLNDIPSSKFRVSHLKIVTIPNEFYMINPIKTFIQSLINNQLSSSEKYKFSQITIKDLNDKIDFKLSYFVFQSMSKHKMLAEDFDLNEFQNQYVDFDSEEEQQAAYSLSLFGNYLENDCARNLEVLRVPKLPKESEAEMAKQLSLKKCFKLKKIIIDNVSAQGNYTQHFIKQAKNRPNVQIALTDSSNFEMVMQITSNNNTAVFQQKLDEILKLDQLKTEEKKQEQTYSNFVQKILTNEKITLTPLVTRIIINPKIISEISNKKFDSLKPNNIQQIHFEYIPNYKNTPLINFFKNLPYLSFISFDQTKIFQNNHYNKQEINSRESEKNDNPLEVLLHLFSEVTNIKLIGYILSEYSSLINYKVLSLIPKIPICNSLISISFSKNQNFQSLSEKDKIKKIIQQRNILSEIQRQKQRVINEAVQKQMTAEQNQKDAKKKDGKKQNKPNTDETPKQNKVSGQIAATADPQKTKGNTNKAQKKRESISTSSTKGNPQELGINFTSAATPLHQKVTEKGSILNQTHLLKSKLTPTLDGNIMALENEMEEDVNDLKQYENYNESHLVNIIDEQQLKEFIKNMPSLCQFNFSNSSIKHEHVEQLKSSIKFEQTISLSFNQCMNLGRVRLLISLINHKANPSFQFDKYLDSLPYHSIKTRKQVKKLIENIVRNTFFQTYMNYLNLGFINKISTKEVQADTFKGIFDPILNMTDLNINMTAFLQSLPKDIKQHVTDEFIKFLTEKYSPIQFIQPEHFNQVQYAFNYIIQQPKIDNEIRIMYLLNPRFQKSISASSFRLIYESIVIKKDQANHQISHIDKLIAIMEKKQKNRESELKNIEKNIKEKKEEMLLFKEKKKKEALNKIKEIIGQKEQKEKVVKKKVERKKSVQKLESSTVLVNKKNATEQDIETFDSKQKVSIFRNLIFARESRQLKRIEDQESRYMIKAPTADKNAVVAKFSKMKEDIVKLEDINDQSYIYTELLDDYQNFSSCYSLLKDDEKKVKLDKIVADFNEEIEKINKEQNKKEKEASQTQIKNEDTTSQKGKSETPQQGRNFQTKKSVQINDDLISNHLQTPGVQNTQSKSKPAIKNIIGLNNPNEDDEGQIIDQVTQMINFGYKKLQERTRIDSKINQIKNSDKSSASKIKKLNNKLENYKTQLELLQKEKEKLKQEKENKKTELINQDILFELFESLNLSYNQYFNQLGLNKFILGYIKPWMNVNLNFEEIQQDNLINLKILQKRNFSNTKSSKILPSSSVNPTLTNQKSNSQQNKQGNELNLLQYKGNQYRQTDLNDQIQSIIKSNHILDDAILKDLVTLISTKMHKVRKIYLSGLNVGDQFSEQFSLTLSSNDQLKYLKRIQLYHNRRISSFGLKFLFSSIVDRIPYGFKIDISPSLYDFESLKKNLLQLEREFIIKLIRISSAKKSEFANDLLEFVSGINKLEAQKKQENQSKQKMDDPQLLIQKLQQQRKNSDLQPFDENDPLNNLKMNKDDLDLTVLRKMVSKAIGNDREKVKDLKKVMKLSDIDENEQRDNDFDHKLTIKHMFTKGNDREKIGEDDDQQDDDDDDDNEDEDYEYEDMIIQMKQIDLKDDILDWHFLSYKGKLDKKLVQQFREKYNQDGEALINRIVSYRKKYEKSFIQIQSQKLEEDDDDLTVMIQNLVNEGLFDTINFIFSKEWQKNKIPCIVVAVILLPFTIFHQIQVLTQQFNDWINNYQFDEILKQKFGSFGGKSHSAEITKLVPKTVGSQDFYFDEDVARLNSILAFEKTENNEKRQDLVVYKKYLNNPVKYMDIFKTVYNPPPKRHILKYSWHIFILYFIVFQLGLFLIWPYFLVTNISVGSCQNMPWYYDIPFYFCTLLTAIIEFMMLHDLEYVISVKQIFSLQSILAITLTYASFMARYDQYTDAIFTFKTLTCEQLHQKDSQIYYIGIASLIVMAINLAFQIYGLVVEYFRIYQKQKLKKQELHNTNYINQYTKIALISEFYGVGISLDRFSTSSANNLDYFFIPKVLRSVKIPQIFQTKFQRVFFEDIPMIVILFIYNTRYITHQWYEWDNLKVILTTILNLYHSLQKAWIARPSIFRTYQMQEFLEFRERHTDIYRLKLYSPDKQPFELDAAQIKLRMNEFRKLNPNIIIKNVKKQNKIEKPGQNKENMSELRGKSENLSQRSGDKSENQHENLSRQSHDMENQSHNSVQFRQNTDIKIKSRFETKEEFQEALFNFIRDYKEQDSNHYLTKNS